MRKFIKRVIGGLCIMSTLMGTVAPVLAAGAELDSSEGRIIEESDTPLRLHYDEETPYVGDGVAEYTKKPNSPDDGWEKWSLPVGNGYFGANVFGRTESERIQITEKTLSNPYYKTNPEGNSVSLGGLNNFSETYLDIGHPFSEVTNYERWLDLKTAVAGTKYDYEGVTYSREVFTSYPDKALVIRLDASENGKVDFTLRPTFPYKQEYATWEGDTASKDGQVVSYMDGGDGIVELTGHMGYYDVDFMGIYRVVSDGGVVSASAAANEYGGTDGTIKVEGANSAYIYVVLGSDYELTEEMFTTSDKQKPTFSTGLDYTRAKIEAEDDALQAKLSGKSFEDAYATLKNAHLEDYCEIFGRVTLDLGDSEDAALTTDALLAKYKSGDYSRYLDMLYFQYGRYLLIASSRPGTLVSNLQGTWNRYNKAPWGSGIWHNINVQMNYWPAFSTNIAETFESYIGYNQAYMKAAEQYATNNVKQYNPSQLGMDGGNGWCIGTGAFPYQIAGDRSAGNMGFTTQLFWEYYQYTQDKTMLETVIFPVLVSAARYIVKSVELTEDGYYLVSNSDSPEMHVDGVWLRTVGTTYAQSFSYQNNYNALLAAKELGIDLSDSEVISSEDLCVFKRVLEQIDKYDPINVGLSGQVKEFRQEDYYCSMGDEPHHRHISQLVGLYPANIINDTTPAWLDAAKVTLTMRGDDAGGWGWGFAHRMNLWARVKDGERTYKLYNDLLTKCTLTNLWDYGTLFQIDGNLGGTAGVSEMLLQSHAGYIAPLAAIPAAWDSGSYTGLVARGNFEVAAEWKNGVATCFNITSKVGGEASVSYGGITSAKVVRASDGKAVDYTVSGTDLITFDTEVGETYIISGFKKVEKLSAPATLTANRMGMGETVLEWSAVEGAVGYNVYTAIENQADYTLVGFTTDTGAVYVPKSENVNARTTFKVVPLNGEGVEGNGTLAYQNPVDINAVIEDYEAAAFDNGELQITVKASDNTLTYKLWKKAAGESDYVLITESPYPIIIYNEYNETDSYALTVVSKYLRTESDTFVIPAIKKASEGSDKNAAKWYTNLLEGKVIEPIDSAALSMVHPGSNKGTYGYDKLTDGVYSVDATGATNVHAGRYSSNSNVGTYMDGVVRFDYTSLLSEVRIYDFGAASATRIGDGVKLYALVDGEWQEVYSISGIADITAAREYDAEKKLYYLPINLRGVKTNALRVYASNNTNSDCVTIYEITCSGAELPTEQMYNSNILLGMSPASYSNTKDHGTNYNIYKLTDGIFGHKEGRFALQNAVGNHAIVEYDLGGECTLDVLRIYDYVEGSDTVSRTSHVTIEVYRDGKWITVVDGGSMLAPNARLSDSHGKYTPFDLGSVTASKIRIKVENRVSDIGLTIYEIELGAWTNIGIEATEENILADKTFTPAEDAKVWSSTYGYDKLTDGVYQRTPDGTVNVHLGRFSSNAAVGAFMDGTMWLNDVYALSELRMYDFEAATRMGDKIEIYAYYAGEWSKVYSIEGRDNINAAKLKDNPKNLTYLSVDLRGVKAEAIRVYAVSGDKNDCVTLYEITCSGAKLSELYGYNVLGSAVSATTTAPAADGADTVENLLAGKTFVAKDSAATNMLVGAKYGYDKLTDGIYDKDANGTKNVHLGRFAAKTVANAYMDGTVELGDNYILSELRMYDFGWTGATATRMGDTIVIYARSGGKWYTVAEYSGLAEISAARKLDTSVNLYYLPIDMSGIVADAIRIYAVNNTDTQGVTLYEVKCSGIKAESNILLGKEIVEGADSTGIFSSGYGYAKLTDGIYNKDASGATNVHLGRYSSKSQLNSCLDGTVELGGVYQLSLMKIYDYLGNNTNRIGDEIIIYTRLNGEWKVAATVMGDATVKAARIKDDALGLYYLPIDLSGVTADAIRVHTKDTLTSNGITLYEITCSGFMLSSGATKLTDSEITAITDGNKDTCYKPGAGASAYTLEFDLGQNYGLYTLNIRDVRGNSDKVNGVPATRSNETYVELYVNGNWVRVADGVSLSVTEEYTAIELYGIAASKIRIGFANTQTFDNGTSPAVIISDLCLSVCGEAADKKPLLDAYSALPVIMNGGAEYDAMMAKFYGYVTEFMLSERKIESYAAEMNAYNATLMGGTHTAHDIVTFDAKAPTCTEKGYYAYEKCTLCDYTTYESILPIGHEVAEIWEKDENGHYKSCGNGCGEKIEYSEHIYTDARDTDCDVCGYIREVEAEITVVAEGTCGVNTTWVLTSDGVLTISGNGDTEDYLVSITTEQPYRAYQDQITKVVIEEGVTSIGRGAFYGFTAITEVVLPESLIAIHEYAFFGCTGIKSVTIPANTFYIGMYAFRKSGLTEMTFANAEGWTFADGTALDVTNVKAFTTEFTYKQTCMRPVTENGTVIANGVFGNKDQFTWTLTSTGVLTVSGTGNMPKFNVNTTPWYGYRGAIRSVVIEEGITSVGRCAFHTCRAITSVTLPESLETIAEYAFYNCQFLTEATIPANVTRIEIYAFRKCYQLKDVTFAINYGWSANGEKISATELNSNAADMLTLVNYTKIWTRDVNAEEEILDPNYVTGGACNTTVKWSLTYTDDTKTKMKLTISGTGAMPKFETAGTPWYGYLDSIVEVEVCEGITEIGRCSFYGLKFVKTATIADTVTAINDYAFNGCFSLKSIEIPASVTYIADTAFTKTGLAVIPTV